MPELPEVEVVRRGLDRWVAGRTVARAEVLHERAARRHAAGGADLADRLVGRTVVAASRRGKYLWMPLDGRDAALVAHLGMSGQLLVQPQSAPDETHLRARLTFTDDGRELRFVDQRTFGGLALDPLVDDGAGGAVPSSVAHIARDPLDPAFDDDGFVDRVLRRRTGLKRALLDQTLVSGIGNIYADEALWLAGLHPERMCGVVRRPAIESLRDGIVSVLSEGVARGGSTMRDYVDARGDRGGYLDVAAVYGRTGQPCRCCGATIVKSTVVGRGTHFCPSCQVAPRRRRSRPA